jgi:4-carboxymuconolactone decarboxylase
MTSSSRVGRRHSHPAHRRAARNLLSVIARPTSPRIEPLKPDQYDDEVRELLEDVGVPGSFASNIFSTLVRHRGLFRRWLPFGGKLLSGRIPARDRELVILRTAWLCNSNYEWGQHVLIARSVGVVDEEIRRVLDGAEAQGWSAFDRTLLRATDELHADACISDETWSALAQRYDTRQLIELPMLVGHYHLVAYALNSLGVQLEPGLEGLPAGTK